MYFKVKKMNDLTKNKIMKRVNVIQNLSYFKNSLLLTLAKSTIPNKKIKI
jgi:hypothetical protein